MTVHLTDAVIPKLAVKNGRPETFYFDDEIQGLSIRARHERVMPQRGTRRVASLYPAPADKSGSVAWGLQWRTSAGLGRVTLGYWPQVKAKQARWAAKVITGMGRDKHPRQHVEALRSMMAYAGRLVEES